MALSLERASQCVRHALREGVRRFAKRGRALAAVEDATFAMPPHPHWFFGRETVVAFLAQFTPKLRHVVVSAGGQPGVAWYIFDEERGAYFPAAIEVLELEGDRVKEITAFADAEALFPRFGLPAQMQVSD